MAMSKKDYEAIAGEIRYFWNEGTGDQADRKSLLAALAVSLADIMAAENPRFDYARFLAACRGEDYEVRGYDSKSGTIQTKRTVRYGS
jgi:hypothetical protein